ncbi:MAG: PDZ domain-containing protein [Gemmatimonadota bacterium]|nr:PDZ domain-containing protein [Gemmatimonadota bacterium]
MKSPFRVSTILLMVVCAAFWTISAASAADSPTSEATSTQKTVEVVIGEDADGAGGVRTIVCKSYSGEGHPERRDHHAGANRGYLGVEIDCLKGDLGSFFGADNGEGALVTRVLPDTPAEKLGLRVGDVLRSVDGKTILNPQTLRQLVGSREAGDEVSIAWLRKGKSRDDKVELATRKAECGPGKRGGPGGGHPGCESGKRGGPGSGHPGCGPGKRGGPGGGHPGCESGKHGGPGGGHPGCESGKHGGASAKCDSRGPGKVRVFAKIQELGEELDLDINLEELELLGKELSGDIAGRVEELEKLVAELVEKWEKRSKE